MMIKYFITIHRYNKFSRISTPADLGYNLIIKPKYMRIVNFLNFSSMQNMPLLQLKLNNYNFEQADPNKCESGSAKVNS